MEETKIQQKYLIKKREKDLDRKCFYLKLTLHKLKLCLVILGKSIWSWKPGKTCSRTYVNVKKFQKLCEKINRSL